MSDNSWLRRIQKARGSKRGEILKWNLSSWWSVKDFGYITLVNDIMTLQLWKARRQAAFSDYWFALTPYPQKTPLEYPKKWGILFFLVRVLSATASIRNRLPYSVQNRQLKGNEVSFLSSIIHSIDVIPRRQDTRSSLGLFYFSNRRISYARTSCSALTFIYHTHGEEDRTEPSVAGKQRSRGEEKWDYLPIQKKGVAWGQSQPNRLPFRKPRTLGQALL